MKSTKKRAALSFKARRRKADLAKRARIRGGAATAAQAEAVTPTPAIFVQSVIHVLGRTPGHALCGTPLPTNGVHPPADAFEQHQALHALGDAIRAAVAHSSGVGAIAVACRGCEANIERMARAQAGGGRTKSKAKAKAEAREREAAACPPDDDEAP
jgi:hypothetical protein